MKGTWVPERPANALDTEPSQGVYTDARGVEWSVTFTNPAGGTGFVTWMAQSMDPRDARKYVYAQGSLADVLKLVDDFADGAGSRGGLGPLLMLALAAYLILDERRR